MITEHDLLVRRASIQQELEANAEIQEMRDAQKDLSVLRNNVIDMLREDGIYEVNGGVRSIDELIVPFEGREVIRFSPYHIQHQWTLQKDVDFGEDGVRTVNVRASNRRKAQGLDVLKQPTIETCEVNISVDGYPYFAHLASDPSLDFFQSYVMGIERTKQGNFSTGASDMRLFDTNEVSFWQGVVTKLQTAAAPK